MGEFSSIKKTYIIFLCIITILLLACARPEVVKITSPEDPLMNCDELELSVVEAQKFTRCFV